MAIGSVSIPDTKLAREITEFIRDTETPLLFHHSSRVYYFGALAGLEKGLRFDPELLYAGAMFHDIGLMKDHASPDERFEVDGANAARDFLRSRGVSAHDLDLVWTAIALHTTPGIPPHMDPIIALVTAGVEMDVLGLTYDDYPDAVREAVVAAHPRGDRFKTDILDAFYDGLKNKPQTTFGNVKADVIATRPAGDERRGRMDLRGNTVFVTGGGSGIGRGLAEDLHARGNRVIIGGRQKDRLEAVAMLNPGMETIELDVCDPDSILRAAGLLVERHPDLNVLINNAGVMFTDHAGRVVDELALTRQVETNLLGPIRMTSALIEHLKRQPRATIVYNTSTLAHAPLADAAVYSATKAALHAYIVSQRWLLRGSSVSVRELAPDFVATELSGSPDPRAMSLDAFAEAAVDALATDAEEIRWDAADRGGRSPGSPWRARSARRGA